MTIRSEIEDALDRVREYRNAALAGKPTDCQYNHYRVAAAYWHGQVLAMQWVLDIITRGEDIE